MHFNSKFSATYRHKFGTKREGHTSEIFFVCWRKLDNQRSAAFQTLIHSFTGRANADNWRTRQERYWRKQRIFSSVCGCVTTMVVREFLLCVVDNKIISERAPGIQCLEYDVATLCILENRTTFSRWFVSLIAMRSSEKTARVELKVACFCRTMNRISWCQEINFLT